MRECLYGRFLSKGEQRVTQDREELILKLLIMSVMRR
jgi:hypothetical protein